MTQCEEISFESEFSKQQAIDEDTAIRFMRSANITRICINLNR